MTKGPSQCDESALLFFPFAIYNNRQKTHPLDTRTLRTRQAGNTLRNHGETAAGVVPHAARFESGMPAESGSNDNKV